MTWLLRASLSRRICRVAWNQKPAHCEPQHSHIYRPAKRGRDFSALWPWNRAFQRKGTKTSLRRNRNSLVLKYTPNLPKISSVSFLTPSGAALVLKHGCVFQNSKGSTEFTKSNYFHLIQELDSLEWTLAASWIKEVPLLPFTVGKLRAQCFAQTPPCMAENRLFHCYFIYPWRTLLHCSFPTISLQRQHWGGGRRDTY